MSRLVNPMCSAIYDVWDRFSSSTWITRSVDGKKWPHEWLKIRPAVLQSLPIYIEPFPVRWPWYTGMIVRK